MKVAAEKSAARFIKGGDAVVQLSKKDGLG
jgi:hypothetical protein